MSLLKKKCIMVLVFSLALLGLLIPGYALADPAEPAVETYCATWVSDTSATLNGKLTAMGNTTTVDVSFEWGTDPGLNNATAVTNPKTMLSSGVFDITLCDLRPQTTYYFRAKAGNTTGPEIKSFTTTGMSLSGDVVTKGLVIIDATLDRFVSNVTDRTLTGSGIDLASGVADTVSGGATFIGKLMSGLGRDSGYYLGVIVSDFLRLFGTRVPFAP